MHEENIMHKIKKEGPEQKTRPQKGPEVPKDGEFEIDRRFQAFARSILLDTPKVKLLPNLKTH